MGIYTRPDSPYFWMLIEGEGIRRSSGFRCDGPALIRKDNRRMAEQLYHQLVYETAKQRRLQQQPHVQLLPPHAPPITKALSGWCYLYAIQAGDRIKIGRAVDVRKRMETLQTGNGLKLSLLVAVPSHAVIEHLIHERFAHLRISGEWYRPEEALLDFLEQIREGTNPIALLWDTADGESPWSDLLTEYGQSPVM